MDFATTTIDLLSPFSSLMKLVMNQLNTVVVAPCFTVIFVLCIFLICSVPNFSIDFALTIL